MDTRGRHLFFLIISQIVICLVASVSVSILIGNISDYMESLLEQEALTITEHKMRERVGSIISYIEHERESVLSTISTQGEFIIRMASRTASLEREALYEWVHFLDTMSNGRALQLVLYDSNTQEKTEFVKTGDTVQEEKTPVPINEWHDYILSCPYHLISPYGHQTLYIIASKESIDEISKRLIYRLIHASVYGTDGYVWVNEVLDYEGGDNYAIRLIHPNLTETEGEFLSTNTTDIEGNLPYLTELEGIRTQGEVFHTYYFQEMNSTISSKKASYAKLYEPFDWIIATGEPLSSVFNHVHNHSEDIHLYSQRIMRSALTYIIILLVLIFAADIGLLVIINMKQDHRIKEYVEKETQQDMLTGTLNRRSGEEYMGTLFQRFQQGCESPLVMMLDLDDFKNINDTYGHDVGDEVLQRATQAISSCIRAGDKLFRWGGEEFVLLFGDSTEEHDRNLGEKILNCVNHIQFKADSGDFSISVSIGSSRFHGDDTSWRQVLKRADMALYHSKGSGKNCYTNYDSDMAYTSMISMEDIFSSQNESSPDLSQLYYSDE